MGHEDLIEALRRMPGVLAEFLREVPEEELHRRRGAGFWTLYEHLEHLVTVQDVLFRRLELIRDEEHPQIKPYAPEEGGEQAGVRTAPLAVEALLALFTRRRARQVEIVEAADESLWSKQAAHPEYERYNFAILVRHILFHDGVHLARMEDLLLARDENLTSA
jgi:uncharacterized damage-inducible protein DinB